jgi:hypothetical protein
MFGMSIRKTQIAFLISSIITIGLYIITSNSVNLLPEAILIYGQAIVYYTIPTIFTLILLLYIIAIVRYWYINRYNENISMDTLRWIALFGPIILIFGLLLLINGSYAALTNEYLWYGWSCLAILTTVELVVD